MQASLEPVVEQPVTTVGSGTFHRSARIAMHRFSMAAVCGYVLVDHVLVHGLGHQGARLRLHPRRDEGGEVHPRAAVQQQLVVDQLVRDFRRHRILRQRIDRRTDLMLHRRIRRAEKGIGIRSMGGRPVRYGMSAQCHGHTLPPRWLGRGAAPTIGCDRLETGWPATVSVSVARAGRAR